MKIIMPEADTNQESTLQDALPKNPAALYQAVADELARTWQPGTRAYIEQHRPELTQEIDGAEAQLNSSWLDCEGGAGGLDKFKEALATWRQANLRAIRAFADTLLLSLASADPGEVEKAREQLRRRGYFVMCSQALGERVAIVEHDRRRRDVPGGMPVYTLTEIRLLEQGIEAGTIRNMADLRQLHEAKRQLGAAVIS